MLWKFSESDEHFSKNEYLGLTRKETRSSSSGMTPARKNGKDRPFLRRGGRTIS